MKPQRLLSFVAALGLFAVLIPLTTTAVFAWSPPGIASVCSNDQNVHNWTVTLATESNYGIQWANNSAFTNATNVTMHAGANSLSTPASVTTLYVRWSSDHNSKSSAAWTGGACSTPSPFQTFQGATATPTLPHTAPPTDPVTATPTAAVTVPPTQRPTDTSAPTATPFQSFQGETATPILTPPSTPFQSFQGETAVAGQSSTPPPTSTGSDGSGNNPTPTFALLISLAFGGIGLAAVEAQRRSMRGRN